MSEFRYMTVKPSGKGFMWVKASEDSMASLERSLLTARIPCIKVERLDKITRKTGRISIRELCNFAQQMETGFDLQMPLVRILGLSIESTSNANVKSIITSMREEIEKGDEFSVAMSRFPNVFDSVFVSFVRAGEQGGIMTEAFEQVKSMLMRTQLVNSKMRSIMIYPAVVSVATISIVGYLMVNTVPLFVKMFKAVNVPLPLATQVVVAISNFLIGNPVLGLAMFGGVIFTALKFSSVFKAFPSLHGIALKIPVFGGVQRKALLANFTRTFGQLLRADVPAIEALYLCRDLSDNVVYRLAIARAILGITDGGNIVESLSGLGPIFGPEVLNQLGFGEETGSISTLMKTLAERQERELITFVEDAKPLIENIMVVLIGAVVGSVVMAMYWPMINIGQAFK